MVRSYQSGNGKRKYVNYNKDALEEAITGIENGLSQAEGSRRFQIPQATLQNRINKKHSKHVGRPTVLSLEEESLIVKTLAEVANWGYQLTQQEMKMMVKLYLDKNGRTVVRFNNNVPGDIFCCKE